MKMNTHTFHLLVAICLSVGVGSCRQQIPMPPPVAVSIAENFIDSVSINTQKISANTIMGEGFIEKVGDSLYFFDKQREHVLTFDMAGNQGGKHLSPEQGPEHVFNLIGYAQTPGLHWIVEGVYMAAYDDSWQFKRRIKIYDAEPEELEKRGVNLKWYNMYFDVPMDLFVHPEGTHFYRLLDYESPTVNACTEEYYLNTRQVMRIEIESGVPDRIFGYYSPEYLEQTWIPYYTTPAAAIGDEYFYLLQTPDSLIYVYTLEGELAFRFGRMGKNMDTDYPRIANYAAYQDESERRHQRWVNARVRKGFYRGLFIDRENKRLFRTYTTGTKDPDAEVWIDNPGRVQVYDLDAMKLIADFAIPVPFRMISQEGGIYYADGGLDEINNELILYTFQLN